ncbi:MAG: hypothetical protein HQM04_17245 [Magnetococcales bacterium]|nr:hypothetical protein [Magnetococcales bacterium]
MLGQHSLASIFLRRDQLATAIRHQPGLYPIMIQGDILGSRHHAAHKFSLSHFSKNSLFCLRSGFPLLVLGAYDGNHMQHVNCLVAFREPDQNLLPTSGYGGGSTGYFEDEYVRHFFVHDDVIGPNVPVRLVSHAYLTACLRAQQVLKSFVKSFEGEEMHKDSAVAIAWHMVAVSGVGQQQNCPLSPARSELRLKRVTKELYSLLQRAEKMPGAPFVVAMIRNTVDQIRTLLLQNMTAEEGVRIGNTLELLSKAGDFSRKACEDEQYEIARIIGQQLFNDKEGLLFKECSEDEMRKYLSYTVSLFLVGCFYLARASRLEWQTQTASVSEKEMLATGQYAVFVLDPTPGDERFSRLRRLPRKKWPRFEPFTPSSLHVAMPEEIIPLPKQLLAATSDKLLACDVAYRLYKENNTHLQFEPVVWSASCFLSDQARYFDAILPNTLSSALKLPSAKYVPSEQFLRARAAMLRAARTELYRVAHRMSRIIGVVRIGVRAEGDNSTTPVYDFLFSTTDSHQIPIAHLVFHKGMVDVLPYDALDDGAVFSKGQESLLNRIRCDAVQPIDADLVCRFGPRVSAFMDEQRGIYEEEIRGITM